MVDLQAAANSLVIPPEKITILFPAKQDFLTYSILLDNDSIFSVSLSKYLVGSFTFIILAPSKAAMCAA